MGVTPRLLAGLLLLALARAGLAQAGHFLTVIGDVQVVTSAGERRAAVRGEALDAGDTVVTGETALAQLTMTDGTRLSIRPDSEFKLDEYSHRGESDTTGRMFMSLVRGTLRSITGLIGSRNRRGYRVRTPHATIGIRGTDHQTTVLLRAREGFEPGTFDVVFSGRTAMQTQAGLVEIAPQQAGYVPSSTQIPRVIEVPAFLQPGAVQAVPVRPGATVSREAAPQQGERDAPQRRERTRERTRAGATAATPLRTPLSSPLRTPLSDSARSLSTEGAATLEGATTTRTLDSTTIQKLESYPLDSGTTTLESTTTRTLDSTTTKTLESYKLDSTTTTGTTSTDGTTSTLRTLDPSTTTTIRTLDPSTTTIRSLDPTTTTTISPPTTTTSPTTTTISPTTTTTSPTTTIIRSLDPTTIQRLESGTTTLRR